MNVYIYILPQNFQEFFFFALSLYAKEFKTGIKEILITVEVKVWNCENGEECG